MRWDMINKAREPKPCCGSTWVLVCCHALWHCKGKGFLVARLWTDNDNHYHSNKTPIISDPMWGSLNHWVALAPGASQQAVEAGPLIFSNWLLTRKHQTALISIWLPSLHSRMSKWHIRWQTVENWIKLLIFTLTGVVPTMILERENLKPSNVLKEAGTSTIGLHLRSRNGLILSYYGFFLGIMFLASVASQPRQASNGRSTARVKRLITSERCWCKKGCYQKFAALVNGLIQFLGIFWDLKKLQQDAYVSHLATLRVLNLPGNLIDGWTVKLWRPRCIGWQRRWLIARDGCCWALKFQESALQRYSA